jgi:hypothetical protein
MCTFRLGKQEDRTAPSNNPLQWPGHDKVHAPDWSAGIGFSGYARQVRRAATERGRCGDREMHR